MCIRDSPDPVKELLEKVSAAIERINAALVADPELLAACETFATTNQPAILEDVYKRQRLLTDGALPSTTSSAGPRKVLACAQEVQ